MTRHRAGARARSGLGDRRFVEIDIRAVRRLREPPEARAALAPMIEALFGCQAVSPTGATDAARDVILDLFSRWDELASRRALGTGQVLSVRPGR